MGRDASRLLKRKRVTFSREPLSSQAFALYAAQTFLKFNLKQAERSRSRMFDSAPRFECVGREQVRIFVTDPFESGHNWSDFHVEEDNCIHHCHRTRHRNTDNWRNGCRPRRWWPWWRRSWRLWRSRRWRPWLRRSRLCGGPRRVCQFASPEWAAAFAQDPQGLKRKLVPIMVRQCQPPGLLSSVVHISLVGEDESAAQGLLLNGLNAKRAKPAQRPSFPGAGAGRPHKAFPGPASPSGVGLAPYVPNLKRSPTDADRRRFSRQAFEVIKAHFQTALDQLAQRSDPVECDFQPNTATEFMAEVFLSGKSACRCSGGE